MNFETLVVLLFIPLFSCSAIKNYDDFELIDGVESISTSDDNSMVNELNKVIGFD